MTSDELTNEDTSLLYCYLILWNTNNYTDDNWLVNKV